MNYTNDGGMPTITTNIDLNNPANFGWAGGRVNMQDEARETETKGVRTNFTLDKFEGLSLRVGAAYDDVSRRINAFDNTQAVAERRLRQQSELVPDCAQHAALL